MMGRCNKNIDERGKTKTERTKSKEQRIQMFFNFQKKWFGNQKKKRWENKNNA